MLATYGYYAMAALDFLTLVCTFRAILLIIWLFLLYWKHPSFSFLVRGFNKKSVRKYDYVYSPSPESLSNICHFGKSFFMSITQWFMWVDVNVDFLHAISAKNVHVAWHLFVTSAFKGCHVFDRFSPFDSLVHCYKIPSLIYGLTTKRLKKDERLRILCRIVSLVGSFYPNWNRIFCGCIKA